MTSQEILQEGTKRINRVETDLRWLLLQQSEMQKAGVSRDCAEDTALNLMRALKFTKRGHKCIQDGVSSAPQLRGPNKDDD